MTLQRKFVVLLAALAMVALANVGAAFFTIDFLQSRAGQWSEIQAVQTALNGLKKEAAAQVHLWAPAFPMVRLDPPAIDPSEARAAFDAAAAKITRTLEDLESIDEYKVRIGSSTASNLHQRVLSSLQAGRAWLRDPAQSEQASREYFNLHSLIERIEDVVIRHASSEALFGRTIRPYLVVVLGASLVGTILTGVLGVALVRRWVVRPVRVLRLAADRLARGDFSHRVPVGGRDELALLSAEINHMAGMISTMQDERVDRERLAAVGEMVRRLAHNLRNPLAGIRSLAELTRGDLPPDSPSRENQDRIVSTVDRFERWLADMLSATTPLQVVPQPVSVGPWLRGVIDPLRAMAMDRGVDLRLDSQTAPLTASFDARHLEQALVAVVTNAIQASPRGKPVEITAAAQDGGWRIRVLDRGPGVPPGLGDKIFRPYFTTKRDGTGIGLAIAKQVIEQHGGRIWVEFRPEGASKGPEAAENGSGAVFVMWLPLATGGESGQELAKPGQYGAGGGPDPDCRGRGESPVLNPADAAAGRA
jgi:signal transduction histidine kinase